MVSDDEARLLTAVEPVTGDYGAASDESAGDADEEEHQEDEAAADDDEEEQVEDGTGQEDAGEMAVAALTRRLRFLLYVITLPIVPLGAIVVLALAWMLYAAFVKEVSSSCSHPLHWYAGASILILLYAPQHTKIRAFLFHYQRDRDGPTRPPNARRCDQVFHTIALLYVYAGITLVQTCRGDLQGDKGSEISSCSATCPSLFQALSVYVVSLEVFTFSIVLPLLFLPCIYMWLLRQATVDGEALSILQERLREEEFLFRNGGVTSSEIMSQLQPVLLVADAANNRVAIVPKVDKDLGNAKDSNGVKECCICMNDFYIHSSLDEEAGDATEENDEEAIVRTQCGHVMHQQCMLSWIDGRWQSAGLQPEGNDDISTRRARRTTCPLCRNDLRS